MNLAHFTIVKPLSKIRTIDPEHWWDETVGRNNEADYKKDPVLNSIAGEFAHILNCEGWNENDIWKFVVEMLSVITSYSIHYTKLYE